MHGEITIKDALDLIGHRTQKDRNTGFQNLKNILRKNKRANLLKDASVHHIFEALFRVAVDDRATYLKATTSTTRSAAANRLSACANTLRGVVDDTVHYIRLRTLRALLDHITQLFAGPEGMFCEPLALDYAKCLTALFQHQPHAEHLSSREREDCMLFCVDAIQDARSTFTDEDTEAGTELTSTTATVKAPSYLSSRSHYKESVGSQGGRSLAKQVAEELIGCLARLTAAPNADLAAKSGHILEAVIRYLQTGTLTMKPQQDAFETINHLLSRITTHDTALMQKNLGQLLRLLRIYWSSKAAESLNALRDKMLVTYIHLYPYIFAAMHTRENVPLRSELTSALNVMRTEYGNRQQRNQLHMEDIRLVISDKSTRLPSSIETIVCSLRCAGPRAEANWTTLHTMASLYKLLSNDTQQKELSEDDDEAIETRPRKRQRMTCELDECVDTSASAVGRVSSRITALHILTFLSPQMSCSSRRLTRILDKLSSSCADDNVDIASWALLAIASFALQKNSKDTSLTTRWGLIWQLASRAMSNASTCRPACHLLSIMIHSRLVSTQTVADFVHTVSTSMDLNGPTVLADSVTRLLTYTVQMSQQTNPTASAGTAESVLGWLFRMFAPSQFVDRDHSVHQVLFEAADIIDLIFCCLGKSALSPHRNTAQYPLWDSVGQAWVRSTARSELTNYLLLLPEAAHEVSSDLGASATVKEQSLMSRPSCETIVLSNLISELFHAQEAWTQTTLKSMGRDMFVMFCKSCHVACSIAFCSPFRDTRRQCQLQKQTQGLLQNLAEFAKTSLCPQDHVDAMLMTFSSAFSCFHSSTASSEQCQCEQNLCRCVSTILDRRNDSLEPSGQPGFDDLMELDDDFDSQGSRRTEHASDAPELQNDNAVAFGTPGLRATALVYTAVRTKQHERQQDSDDQPSNQVLDIVLSLPAYMVFASRGVISRLSGLGLDLTVEDAARLAEFCIQNLGVYQFERSEVALGAILDIMASITSVWTNPSNTDLYADGLDIYEWYISTGLPHRFLSPNVQCRLASLLLQLCHVDFDYGQNDSCPSARTSIFELVSKGGIEVQYHLAGRISTIFGLFVLSNHPLMFNELRKVLPENTNDVEGMAMRLLFFSKLASAWHSLLRECVYYIVETAGESKPAAKFAGRCMSHLATSLQFDSPQKLFRLFASQLLHSWLDRQSVTSLPFAVFQYDSLGALILNNVSEITAQLVVRGNDDGLEVVVAVLKTTKAELLKRTFAKCEAYCISYDISRTSAETEGRLRSAVGGKDHLVKLASTQYPAILAQFFLSAQNEDVEDNWLEKRGTYKDEAKALKEMKSYSYSHKDLPACQQPSFKSKWLCDQIERLCRRVGKNDPSQRWDPSSFAFAAQTLLDSIDPSLGPLHTCLVIRRLRILVCLARDVAVADYQLEMLISALRPYLNDSQCADDAMGVLQYLFRRGQVYLKTQLPFTCGTITLMILQIRKHSAARQESTTQQSQHKATVEKMHCFHAWLIEYLKDCTPPGSPESETHAALVQSLAQIQLPGNATRSSPESALLLMLIGDDDVERGVFRSMDRQTAFLILSENFQLPQSVEEDCLNQDRDCVRLVQHLWRIIRLPGLGKPFITWIAGAIGRSYAASGQRPLQEGRNDMSPKTGEHEGIAQSQAAIAKRLVNALYGAKRGEASTADTTLRNILLSFGDADEALAFENMLPPPVVSALQQSEYGYAPVLCPNSWTGESYTLKDFREPSSDVPLDVWVQRYCMCLCLSVNRTPVLPALTPALRAQRNLALDLFPMIVHILLAAEMEKDSVLRTEMSACIAAHLSSHDSEVEAKQAYLLQLLLYLRSQIWPGEHTQADRLRWLEVDWLQAADAAVRCNMPETALLFAESASTPSNGNRRSSSRVSMSQLTMNQFPQDLLLSIFKLVDEPDSFYGVEQAPSLESVLGRFDYEKNGFRSLMFRSAQTDTKLLRSHKLSADHSTGMVRSLSMLNLSSLTYSLLSAGGAQAPDSTEELLNSARKLQQWDIALSEATSGPASTSFTMFQELSRATEQSQIHEKLQSVLLAHLHQLESAKLPSREWFSALASIVEVGEVLGASSGNGVHAQWERMKSRQEWMHLARFDDVGPLLSNRSITFSTLVQNGELLKSIRRNVKDLRATEIDALLNVSSFAREHNQLQEALTAVSRAGDLVSDCEDNGLKVGAAVKLSTASVLWDSQEAAASVKMMREILDMPSVDEQDIGGVGRAGLMARLAHQLGEARLEKADSILSQYLEPAIRELKGRSDGAEAGEVFHEFAAFCDKQLQNPGSIEDFERIARLRQKKWEEVQELEKLMKSARRRDQQENYSLDHRKARKWFEIDDADYQRLKRSRDTFMQQSLQNYLLTLRATNKYNISVLRLFALWLENADVAEANHVASRHLPGVPSWKFVLLMNQLMSRLEADGSTFQKALTSLLLRICSDHPHHSLHHLFATTRKPANGEQAAASRQKAAMTIRMQLSSNPEKGKKLERTFTANKMYDRLAYEDGKHLSGKASIKDLASTEEMRQRIPNMRVPPITINVTLRPNGEYSDVPVISRFGSTVRIMSGLSRPKSISVYATDGQQYQQLFKSGNDDLRQDAIMEQVFEEVSKMLRNHTTTRQRDLVVRTYKVIPLGSNSGAIEFVPNSVSFSEFLKPAHERYYPQDYKESKARSMINAVKDHPTDVRIKEFRKVCEHMHPVMRHFFFERFTDPDDWFRKRTAYTRTTATISILGYILGLGDRHCQNIMLDEKTGEVVHIDLGVAFEAGRILPVPELVPFRLSRDVVDGMGITKTEGVFRRCCEFTMDALREDKDSIMTLLNVLRYDPLYTWNVSPLRAKRMQEETGRDDGAGSISKKRESEAGEADRALSVVEKKLSKTLSTAATVSELIQQATDERNLATLFSGWSAWF